MIRVALVTAYDSQNRLLLGRRRDLGTWTLPGGHLEDGEDPKDGALRELLEETGLTPKSLSFLTKYTTAAGVELNVYSAYVMGEPHSHLDPDDEVSEWRFLDVSKGMPKKVDSKLHGPEDDSNILRQLYDLAKSLPKTEKCAKCSKQATTRVLWAEGMAYQPACDDHIAAVKKPFVDKDEFCGLRPIEKADLAKANRDVFDFKDGNGPVPAHRHPLGKGWVADSATVAKTAYVDIDARVFGHARVLKQAQISGHARVYGSATVTDTAHVYGYAQVFEDAVVAADARIAGHSEIGGKAKIGGTMWIGGDVSVAGTEVLDGDERLHKADTRFKFDGVCKTFRFPDEGSAEEFSRRCRNDFEDSWKGIGVSHRDEVRVVVRAWDESNMDDFQHAAKEYGGKVIDDDHLDYYVSPEYRRKLNKAEHEVARLLTHPNPVERLMALRLNSVGADHINSAMLDADPRVHEAAISHPMFCDVDGLNLAQASADSAGNYPLANQLAFLRSPHVVPEHLSELISRSPVLHPAAQQQLFDEIIKHPALAPDDISRLYSDYGTTGAQRLALLDHPNTPEPVLHQAIKLGVEVPGDAQPFSTKAAAHPNLSPEFRSAFVRKIPVSAPEYLLELGCHLLRSGPVTPDLARDLQVQRSLKGAPFDRLLAAYLQGPSATADDISQAIESGNPVLLQGAAQSRALLPHQLDGIVAQVKASGDQQALMGLMDHKFFGNRHLQMLLAKREEVGSVDQAMIGHCFSETPEFLAAKFLSGLPAVSEMGARDSYFRAGQDISVAALTAYGFEVTRETLASLKGAVGLGLAPAEVAEEPIPATDVIADFCSGADVAEAVKRAGAAGKLVHVRNGVLHADDPKGSSWFLRREGAEYLPQSDAAWYQVAKSWGVDKYYPRTELITMNAVPYAATAQIPSSYKTLGYVASRDPNAARKQLGKYLGTGQVHIWAAMDAILGNRDANEWSVLVEDCASERSDERSMYAAMASIRSEPQPEPPGIYFVNHGNLLGQALGLVEGSYVPYVLTVFTNQADDGALTASNRLERLPRVDAVTAEAIKKWLMGIDLGVLNGTGPGLDGPACANRLQVLRELTASYPADEAINRYFSIQCT